MNQPPPQPSSGLTPAALFPAGDELHLTLVLADPETDVSALFRSLDRQCLRLGAGGQFKRTDLERLLDGTGEEPPSAPRYSSEAKRLYRHLYLFLHSEVLRDGRTAAERLLAPEDWQRERNDETKWSVQLPTGVGPAQLEYPLERVACLSTVVRERTPPDGALAKTGGLSLVSCLAHGRLFFLMVRNYSFPSRIQSLTLHGGEINPAQNVGKIEDERMVFPLRVRIESSAPPTSTPGS